MTSRNVERLTDFTWRIRQALERDGITGADGAEIDHIELFGPPSRSRRDSRNFVLCPGKAYDRSPCGTGTSAKLACLAADGKLKRGEVWRQESIVGSVFEGTYRLGGRSCPPVDHRLGVRHRRGDAAARPARSVPHGDPLMSETADVVVGAGIVGAACAEALSGEGLRVVIVESGIVRRQSDAAQRSDGSILRGDVVAGESIGPIVPVPARACATPCASIPTMSRWVPISKPPRPSRAIACTSPSTASVAGRPSTRSRWLGPTPAMLSMSGCAGRHRGARTTRAAK